MRMIEWAFEQQLPTAEKIVLVWLARNANSAGVGLMARDALEKATGYKKRSAQRLLKSLRDSQHLVEHGIWYAIGNAGLGTIARDGELAQLPDAVTLSPAAEGAAADEDEAWKRATAALAAHAPVEPINADAIGEAIAKHVADAGEFMLDQLQNFEVRLASQLTQLALLHVEHNPTLAPPPDPVIENPLYGQLIESGMGEARAYKLSETDLAIGEDLDSETPPVASDGGPIEYKELFDAGYADDAVGRYERIVDILHGAQASEYGGIERHLKWQELETVENKHSKSGEIEAFLLLYPAIVAAAKANVGKLSIDEFLDPHVESRPGFKQAVTHGIYVWDQEIDPLDKDDPACLAEIAVMLAELEQAHDPRCEVHARTSEEGEDGVVRQETVLGYYRRVKAKHYDMIKLRTMGVLE